MYHRVVGHLYRRDHQTTLQRLGAGHGVDEGGVALQRRVHGDHAVASSLVDLRSSGVGIERSAKFRDRAAFPHTCIWLGRFLWRSHEERRQGRQEASQRVKDRK